MEDGRVGAGSSNDRTYPEINLQIARAPEFPISHLKRHGHLVVLVQDLVEAFPRVWTHLYVVPQRCEGEEAAEEEDGEAIHDGWRL